MSWLTIVNTCFIILYVDKNALFTTSWYKSTGITLCMTIFTMAIVGNLLAFIGPILAALKKCFDRGCKTNSKENAKNTRQLTQFDYEEKQLGNEFGIEKGFGNMVLVIFVTFSFSAGMPILYLLACVYFLITYWVDKVILLKFSRKPPNYSISMVKGVISSFKYAILIHVIIGIQMFDQQ